MNALRLTGAVLALALVVAVAGLLSGGTSGCLGQNCAEGIDVWDCAAPDGGLLGAATACSPSERPANCPCAVGAPIGHNDPATGMPYVVPQGDCEWLDGGPIGCNGQCVAGGSAGWLGPGLVWICADIPKTTTNCPPAAPNPN
jgi:hypothetical protein